MISTVLLGSLGWFAVEFLGRPIRSFFDLRREIRRQILFLGDVRLPEFHQEVLLTHQQTRLIDEWKAARKVFRDLGSQVIAFGESEFLATMLLRALKFDVATAGTFLMGLAETGAPYEEGTKFRSQIAKALRFKTTGEGSDAGPILR